jgi:hypothetical protein
MPVASCWLSITASFGGIVVVSDRLTSYSVKGTKKARDEVFAGTTRNGVEGDVTAA